MLQEEKEYPSWIEDFEKPKLYKLGHELGAGAPCTGCSYCPGLQLHYWRKKCTLCGCQLDDHEYERDGFPQYNIIFGNSKGKKFVLPFKGEPTSFDWVPEQDNPSVIEEYMESLPNKWRPITGTLGGDYRKKQLRRQLPRYDVDILSCHPLNEDELKKFDDYQQVMRENAAGLGSVFKLDDIYRASPAWVVNSETATLEPVLLDPQYVGELPRKYPLDEIISYCHGCQKPIKNDTVVVTADRINKSLWHAGCFTCASCDELLVDLHYFSHNGKVYCGRDYAQAVKKPRCNACDELIFERDYTCANGLFYHICHFCCSFCDKTLAGQQFVQKGDNIICPSCFQNEFPKTCMTCKLDIPLFDHRVEVSQNVYHKNPDCFRCGICQSSLENERVFCNGSLIICSNCSPKKA